MKTTLTIIITSVLISFVALVNLHASLALITFMLLVGLVINPTIKFFKNKTHNGNLTKEEVAFIKEKGLNSDLYMEAKGKTFNELNLAQRMNDSLFLQSSLAIRSKVQSETAFALNMYEEATDRVLPIKEEVIEEREMLMNIYSKLTEKLKGRTEEEKFFKSNGVKFSSYRSKAFFLIPGILAIFVGIAFGSVAGVIGLSAITVVGMKLSLTKKKLSLSKTQIEILKETIFNNVSKIETINDEILGFARRNNHVVESIGKKANSKLGALIKSTQ